MQIVINTRLLLKDKLEGMGWFAYQTLKHITTHNPNVHFVFVFDRNFDSDFIFADNITPLILSPQARHPFLYYAWFQHSVKGLLNKMKPDLFLSPDGFLSLGAKCKQLPVIHDINFLHHPKDSKWLTAEYYNFYFPKFAKQATRIATVSEYSKYDIVKNYGISPEKIDVVYNGINSFFKPLDELTKQQTKEKYSSGKNYFINVGSLHPRKNITNLVRAFSIFKKESNSDFKLVLAGPDYWGVSDIHKIIKETNLNDDVIFTGRLKDEELNLVLGSAFALTFVPYYEGFGIPLVEAMQTQTPIITSNVTSLPEVAGEAALLVNPLDAYEIKNAMLELFQKPELRESLINKGKIQKEKFSWEKSGNLLWESVLKATQ
ncbi:MAG: glycosyltransferase family 1 protein [Bacteroidota bacterium]|nr:glycosyltransferase family 1 protein [Bacteroidota bacterium]